ncbi:MULTISPECIES: Abi family protein [Rhodopirellula]|uniref:Abi family protein n=1 Tax=Rhodopirellula TaxID=265488 RepID=UPI002580F4DA|nr:Abi family protein [Rhodopirellula sp. UBA1907]
MTGRPYDKPWCSLENQLQKIRDRGIVVHDEDAAIRYLRHLNYYRFSGYCLAFETERHVYPDGTTFEQIIQAYEFDLDLRDLLTEALETIEVDLRTSFAYHFGEKYGAFGHVEEHNFFHTFDHDDWIGRLREEATRSSELFVTHFQKTYAEYPDLPVWMVTEVASFGGLSRMYSGMKRSDQKTIAQQYRLQPDVVGTWMHHFVYVRNLCAHHARLWDRQWSIRPAILRSKEWQPKTLPDNSRLFVTLLVIKYMLKRMPAVSPFMVRWSKRVEEHLDNPPSVAKPLLPMGLTYNWKQHPVWR